MMAACRVLACTVNVRKSLHCLNKIGRNRGQVYILIGLLIKIYLFDLNGNLLGLNSSKTSRARLIRQRH